MTVLSVRNGVKMKKFVSYFEISGTSGMMVFSNKGVEIRSLDPNKGIGNIDAFTILCCSKRVRQLLEDYKPNKSVQYSIVERISGDKSVTSFVKKQDVNKSICDFLVYDISEYNKYERGGFSHISHVYIHAKCPDYYNRKKNLFNNWLKEQCRIIFNEIVQNVHKKFIPYDISFPQITLRNMKSRWGSCQPNKCVITLNKHLIEAPKSCIEYVVYHEFCHFIHPNHSKQFYSLLQIMLPDWKERKYLLEKFFII